MMRPKLKEDTFYMPIADGVFFRNNQGSFKIKGKAVYSWVENLVPYLNGQHTLEEITQGLDPEKQAMAMKLVDTLMANQFLKDTSHDLIHTLSPTELETYTSEIAFIDSFADSAASSFERFREQRILVIGSGLTLTRLVHASLKCGIRQLAVLTTQECETNTSCYYDYLEQFHQGDPRQTLREIEDPDWDNETGVRTLLQPFDTIIHISDRPMLARAMMLNRLCVAHQKTLIQAILVGHQAWVGPLVRSEAKGCWECAWRRLQANLINIQEKGNVSNGPGVENRCKELQPLPMAMNHMKAQLIPDEFRSLYAFQDQTIAPISHFVTLSTATLVANQLAFEILKYVTGAGSLKTVDGMIEVDLETLQSERHPFLPHPLCRACHSPVPRTAAMFLDTIHQLEQGEPLDPDLFSKRVASYFEKRLGLFHSIEEGDFKQIPLSMCKAVISNPLIQDTLGNPSEVIGAGTHFGLARHRATNRVCEIYAASLVDQRLLPDPAAYQEHIIQADRFLASTPLAEVNEWTWASDLQTGQACLVPASLVYPLLRDRSPLSEAGLGVMSGMSWAEAISRALLNLCQHLTLIQLDNAREPYPLVDLAITPLGSEGTHFRRVLDKIGQVITIYDVTGPLQIPTFAICLQDKTVAYSTHLSVTQALEDGLELATQYWQASSEQLPAHCRLTVPNLPVALRGNTKVIPEYASSQHWPQHDHEHVHDHDHEHVHEHWPECQHFLQQTLQEDGWHAFAAPLDQDLALHQVQPYIVHVLLAHA